MMMRGYLKVHVALLHCSTCVCVYYTPDDVQDGLRAKERESLLASIDHFNSN